MPPLLRPDVSKRCLASAAGFAMLVLLNSTDYAAAVPAPPIEFRAVVACEKGLRPLPPPDNECLAEDVVVGDLDIAGIGRENPRNDTGDLQISLMEDGNAHFANYERGHAGGRFAILIGGRVIATSVIGDPAYRRPLTVPGLRAMIVPSLITVPGLTSNEVEALSRQFRAETALEWCARHAASTDKYALQFCSGYKSQADLTEPAPVINADSLRAAKPLEGDALKFDCVMPKRYGPGVERLSAVQQKKLMQDFCRFLIGDGPDGLLAPPQARNVKLAMRTAFRPSFGLPATEIHIAISSATEGTFLLAQRDKKVWETRNGALTPGDIAKIIAALETSHFWQLPFDHQFGVVDGEPILVEAAFDGWRHTSTQNAYAGVDLDILAKQLSAIARAHNTERPLSWFK